MKKILVTGGLGAVGTYLVRELKGRGHEVFVCDLRHHHERNYARCDISEFRQVERLWKGGGWEHGYVSGPREFDLVYHLAAEFGRWNGEDYYENVWKTNAIGTKNILRMQEEKGFQAVYFSSSEVYGDYEGLMSEDVMDRLEIKQMNDYAISKWVNEMQVLNSAAMKGTKSVRVRLFNTYGPGEHYSKYRSVLCMFIYRALMGLPYTVYTKHTRTSIYISDMGASLASIADHFYPGEVYNLGGLDYHGIKEASDLVLKHTGGDQKLVNYLETEPHTTMHKKVDCQKAIQHLQHAPKVGLDEGIALTVQWARSVYLKK